MLKKQTVWLLTMLSLVVVLSVYYVTTPEQSNNAMPTSFDGSEKQGTEKSKSIDKSGKETSKEESTQEEDQQIVQFTSEDSFTALRLKVEDERSEVKEHLQEVMTSEKATAEQKHQAKTEFDELNALDTKERLLETLIKAKGNYDDALVRVEGNNINIAVKAEKQSAKEANEILRLVESEIGGIGDKKVAVQFQPIK